MEVSLISPYGNIDNIGLRTISSYLKKNSIKVNLIFLPFDAQDGKAMIFDELYPQEVLDQLAEICKNSKLIGMSVMANYFPRCKQITKSLKQTTDALIVWGGIHATFCPEDCSKDADVVCVGEGEDVFLKMCQVLQKGEEVWDIRGIAYTRNGEFKNNGMNELVHDLDVYPDPDYIDMENHYILKDNKIIHLTKEILKDTMWVENGRKKYMTFTTRGCPHRCTFCCNSTLVKLYQGKGNFIRKRSVERVIQELETIKREFPFVEYIGLGDEVFFIRSDDEIKEFAEKYKQRIGLPLQCEFSPMTVTENKMKWMIDAGTIGIQMGVQSGSDGTNFKMYERYQTRDTVLKAANIIDKYKDKLEFYCYHFIIGNPLESAESMKESIRLYFDLPDGFLASVFTMVFYPGAKLTEEALTAGLIKEDDFHYSQGWNVRKYRDLKYMDYLFKMLVVLRNRKVLKADKKFTKFVVKALTSRPAIAVFDRKLFLRPMYYSFLGYSKFVHPF